VGDNCCDPLTMGHLQGFIEAQLPGVYVYSVMVGDSPAADTMHGFLGDVNAQVEAACATLAAEPRLAAGFNAVGFSQGGQFLRAVVQRCGGPGGGGGGLKVKQLITLGGQHQGVASIPGCEAMSGPDGNGTVASTGGGTGGGQDKAGGPVSLFCKAAEAAIGTAVYSPFVRSSVVQAQYFKDPAHLPSYLAHNPFLPDINNEKAEKNPVYKANLAALERLVLIRFSEDTTVVPRDSSWFGWYASGARGGKIVPLRQQAMYTEDWLGLRALDQRGALIMSDCPGQHMQFSEEWFKVNVVDKYLRSDDGARATARASGSGADVSEGGVRESGHLSMRGGGAGIAARAPV